MPHASEYSHPNQYSDQDEPLDYWDRTRHSLQPAAYETEEKSKKNRKGNSGGYPP
jgi:hypothetical protein